MFIDMILAVSGKGKLQSAEQVHIQEVIIAITMMCIEIILQKDVPETVVLQTLVR